MPDKTTPAPVRGDTVWVLDPSTLTASTKYPGPWKVERVNDKSYGLSQGRVTLRAGKTLVTLTEPSATAAVIEWRDPWVQGTLVRWTASAPVAKAGTTLFVVITDTGMPTVKLVPLGNKCGRVWPKAPAAALTEVDPAEVLREGAAAA